MLLIPRDCCRVQQVRRTQQNRPFGLFIEVPQDLSELAPKRRLRPYLQRHGIGDHGGVGGPINCVEVRCTCSRSPAPLVQTITGGFKPPYGLVTYVLRFGCQPVTEHLERRPVTRLEGHGIAWIIDLRHTLGRVTEQWAQHVDVGVGASLL